MKIVVFSDTHGSTAAVEQLAGMLADAVFHCGDSELSADHPRLKGVHAVRGNCDLDARFPEMLAVDVGGTAVFAAHGHQHSVNHSLLALSYAAQEARADIALFGHTHIYGAEMIGGVLFVNPGSAVLPRGGRPATYAVIEIADGYKVSFYTMENKLADEIIFMK